VDKTKFYHFWPTLEKGLEKSTSAPLEKNPSDSHAQKHVKLHRFLQKKLRCITSSGNIVQQHQCGKQAG